MAIVARHVLVSGRVQGVGFRWLVRSLAHEHGLVGWVKNLEDGRVEAFLEGEEAPVAAALAAIRSAPFPARVDACEVSDRPIQTHARFTVIR